MITIFNYIEAVGGDPVLMINCKRRVPTADPATLGKAENRSIAVALFQLVSSVVRTIALPLGIASLLVISAVTAPVARAQSAPARPAVAESLAPGQATGLPVAKTIETPPKAIQQHSENMSWMTNKESVLAGFVLLFGVFLAVVQSYLMLKKDFKAHEIIRLSALTFIIVGTLFIVTAGYDATQIAPVMGLFGTIAGYILGRTQGGSEHDPHP